MTVFTQLLKRRKKVWKKHSWILFFATKKLFVSIPWLCVCVCVRVLYESAYQNQKEKEIVHTNLFVGVWRELKRGRGERERVRVCVWVRKLKRVGKSSINLFSNLIKAFHSQDILVRSSKAKKKSQEWKIYFCQI